MMTKEKALDLARASGWLSEQSVNFQEDVLSRCHLRNFRDKETIYHMGDPPTGFYCVVSGTIRFESAMAGGDYKVVTVKQPVSWFGQGSSLSRRGHTITAAASAAVSLLHLSHHDLERLVENASYCRAFTMLDFEHLNELMKVIGHLLVGDVEQRIALRLAVLAERTDKRSTAMVPITQSDLAEMCGLSRPTVQQVLSNLQRRGLIRAGYRKIEILDSVGLAGCRSEDAPQLAPAPSI
jgi:CRP-like cAMP-binding protein